MRNGDEKNLQFQTDLQKLRYALELIPYHHAQTASWSSLYSTDVSFNNPNLIYLPTEPHQILPTRAMLMFQTNPVGVDLFSFVTLSFVPINLHRCYSREWKRSIGNRLLARWRHFTTTTRILFVFLFVFKFYPSEI